MVHVEAVVAAVAAAAEVLVVAEVVKLVALHKFQKQFTSLLKSVLKSHKCEITYLYTECYFVSKYIVISTDVFIAKGK